MSVNIIVASHGRFCEEIIKSAEMIVGKNERLFSLPLLKEEDPMDYRQKLEQIVKSFGNNPFIIICDIIGGTPYNCALQMLQKYNCAVLTGLSLPMLLEAYYLDSDSVDETGEILLNCAQSTLQVFTKELMNNILK
ncbi:MAG: PTS sugar transporter subunit IIA [Erysipelotrichia bacterium]|nr:PTS sugar transporter subunit IIA [Erysipelotrichia bacterium]